jgi:hypothetical protein
VLYEVEQLSLCSDCMIVPDETSFCDAKLIKFLLKHGNNHTSVTCQVLALSDFISLYDP